MKEVNHEYYVSPEVANLLKEAGFDWRTLHLYHKWSGFCISLTGSVWNWNTESKDATSIPTLEVAQRWLREVKGKEVEIEVFPDELVGTTWGFNLYDLDTCDSIVFQNPYTYNTYEEAKETGIKKALEIILEKGE